MKRGDIAVALCLLALAGALLLLRGTGSGAVYVNGVQAGESITVNGVSIEIDGTRARIKQSPCRDQFCVRAGWIERNGEVAVCLPQRVIAEIRGSRSGVDSVAY